MRYDWVFRARIIGFTILRVPASLTHSVLIDYSVIHVRLATKKWRLEDEALYASGFDCVPSGAASHC
jgi:hypothetical protein